MSGTLKLTRIRFAAGPNPAPGTPPLDITPSSVVVLIGPNNSGKSLALREIAGWCDYQDVPFKLVDHLEVNWPSDSEEALRLVRQFEIPAPLGFPDPPVPEAIYVGQLSFDRQRGLAVKQVGIAALESAVRESHVDNLRAMLSSLYSVRLDGRSRFALVDPMETGDLLHPARNLLWSLFQNDESRERIRSLTVEAFGLHYVIDPTAMTEFRVRMSREPVQTDIEQNLGERGREFHAKAPLITELGDGVQAFVGLVSAVLSLPHRIILIDEPEAFLHPPLARRLGGILARLARERNCSLLVATHSSEFLIGCLESDTDTSVIRLGYEGEVATARALIGTELSEMVRHPLLRSTDVLRALFHRAAVVTEADSDRAFYDEMNARLLAENRGIRDVLFLNAQNKQTVHRIVGPLRRIGIPTVAIVDLDILEEEAPSKAAWHGLLEACQIPEAEQTRLDHDRKYLANAFDAVPYQSKSKKDRLIKANGIRGLRSHDKVRAEVLLRELRNYGLFLVPVGEVENWLGLTGRQKHGNDWLVDVFSLIGGAANEENYLRPGLGDVWQFLDDIETWVSNQRRVGTS